MKMTAVLLLLAIFFMLASCNDNATNEGDCCRPRIDSIVPNSAKVGEIIRIYGYNFTYEYHSNIISFGEFDYTTGNIWGMNQASIEVPDGALSGKLSITYNGKKSNELDFIVEGEKITENIQTVLIPAGTFQMGNTGKYSPYYKEDEDEFPVHSVTITKPFYMGKYEVTNRQWEAVMGPQNNHFQTNYSVRPVESNWLKAIEFCNKLSEKDGLTKCYTIDNDTVICDWNANGWRLPTEAEWEYACKAGTTTDFYNGDIGKNWSYDKNLDKIAWYSTYPLRAVGLKEPNAFGLYDMLGNLSEWCWDYYGEYNEDPVIDPKGAIYYPGHVYRGGACHSMAVEARSAKRYHTSQIFNTSVGFRVVRNF